MDEKVILDITLNTINIVNKLVVIISEVCDKFCLNWDDLAQYATESWSTGWHGAEFEKVDN